MPNKKIVLYLMNEKGLYCLQKLIENNQSISYIVTASDSGTLDKSYEKIIEYCKSVDVVYYNRKEAPILEENNLVFAIGWRWIINFQNVIVLHDSLLPKYRGFNPLPTALINGDTKIGVTALYATDNYDEGDIIFQEHLNIIYPCKIGEVIEIIKICYFKLVSKIIGYINNGLQLPRQPQKHSEAIYSLWRNENDYKVDWTNTSTFIKRFVDALGYPYKGASTKINERTYRICDVEIVEDVQIANRDCGKIIFKDENYPVVVCGIGLIKILSLTDETGNIIDLGQINFRTRFE